MKSSKATQAERVVPPGEVQKRLAEIAAAIKAGKNPAKFEKEMDRLLGTEMPDRNREAEAKAQAQWDVSNDGA